KEPAQRYPTCQELATTLRGWLKQHAHAPTAVEQSGSGHAPPLVRPPRSTPAVPPLVTAVPPGSQPGAGGDPSQTRRSPRPETRPATGPSAPPKLATAAPPEGDGLHRGKNPCLLTVAILLGSAAVLAMLSVIAAAVLVLGIREG